MREIQVGVGCPKPITACSDRVSSSWIIWVLLAMLVCFLFIFEFSQKLLAGLLPPLLDFLHTGMNHSWAWRRKSTKISQLSWTLFFPGKSPVGFFQADPWTVWFFLSLGLGCCYLVLFPSLRILNSTVHGHHSQGCPWTLHRQQFFPVCKYEAQQTASSFLELQSPVSGSNCQHIPETYWIACVLLWC